MALAEHAWSDERLRFTLTVQAGFAFHVTFRGRGSVPGTAAFIDRVEQVLRLPGADGALRGVVDLTELRDVPLRAQLALGKWLFGRRASFRRVALVGSGPMIAIARAVTAMGGLDQVGSFSGLAEGCAWAGTSPEDFA